MKRVIILCAILLVALLAASCSDQKAPTALPESIPVVTSSLAKSPPASSGPIVVRFETGFAVTFFDPNRLLLALIASDNSFLGCSSPTVFEPADFQLIFSPSGPVHQLAKAKESFTAVYDVTGLPLLDCALLTGPRKLAEGTAHHIATDNDLFFSGTRTNTFRLKGNGQLTNLVDGGTVNYNLHFHFQIKQDGSFEILANDIKLTP